MSDDGNDINNDSSNPENEDMESISRTISENPDALGVGNSETVLLKTVGESTKSEINLGIRTAGMGKMKSDKSIGIVSAIERRITEQLILYWQKLRLDRAYPDIGDIKKDDLDELWDDCFIIEFEYINSALTHTFNFIGDNISDIAGKNVPKEQILSFIGNNLASQYERVLETKRPLIEEAEFKNLNNKVIKYRQILLPVGSDSSITHILGGVRFKEF